jgi:hypothetical protein
LRTPRSAEENGESSMKRHGENVIDLRHYREQRMRARRYASPLSAATHERVTFVTVWIPFPFPFPVSVPMIRF